VRINAPLPVTVNPYPLDAAPFSLSVTPPENVNDEPAAAAMVVSPCRTTTPASEFDPLKFTIAPPLPAPDGDVPLDVQFRTGFHIGRVAAHVTGSLVGTSDNTSGEPKLASFINA
jgi:hypothetical protein